MPLPGNKIVTYKARETPSDSGSNVLLLHHVHISAAFQSGDDISWSIDKLTFDQPGGGSWTNNSPGLSAWVVTHADPSSPVAGDFTQPPVITGGASKDGGGDKLDYDFKPGSCDATEGAMYGGDVVCAEYSYVAGTETIAEEDEDEPEETVAEDDPS